MAIPPAVFEPGSVMLFQGDSITDGIHRGDMNHAYGHGYACEIASRYQAYRPKDRLEFANRGVSGNTSSNLVERWARDAFPYEISENGYEGALGRKKGEKVIPDCVSILVGINDYFHFIRKDTTGVSVEDYEANLRKLIADAKMANPKVRIVLCEPFRIPTDASPEFCRRQDVTAKLAAELDCAFVPFQKLFAENLLKENPNPRYWFWDFFHPTPAGHMRMADLWIESVDRRVRRMVRNTAVEPRAKLEDDSYDWYARHERIVKDQAKIDPEIVFIGDSITHGWEANDNLRGDAAACFRKWFGKYRTLNMGFGWDRVQNVLWRLSHGELDGTKPRVVVIHIGTNNAAPGCKRPFPANTADEIAEGIVEVCRRVREKTPSAKIVLMDVFPRGGKDQHWRKEVAAVNAALGPKVDALADGNLVRISLWDEYVGSDGEIPKELMFDTLHPTAKGYDVWGAALQSIIEGEGDVQPSKIRTFCNPLPLPNLPKSVYINCGGKGTPHRQVSDPNLVRADGAWYLFPSAGFVWKSGDDGGNWKDVPNPDGFAGHGPGAMRHRGKWYYIPNTDGELFVADRAEGPYRSLGRIGLPQEENLPPPADAMLFSDDDKRFYLYWGCTPRGGIWGCELDAENPLRVVSAPVELVTFDPEGQPWERSSNNPQNGWLEGSWMLKLNGRYCLTFSAGGAENETYAMGAYWSDKPLADFKPQRRNPFFISPKGLVTGTGHGSVVQDERGQLWVSYCIRVGSRHWFERLVGMDRLRLDANGEIEPASATSEPQFLPSFGMGAAGWRRIPVRTQSAGAADESLQTFTWLLDLPGKIDYTFVKPQVVRSFRICWREDGYDPDNGVPSGPFRYRLVLRDADGRETVVFDASANAEDRLVDYREIVPNEAVAARLELLAAPQGIKAGVADFTLFGESIQ